MKAARMLARLSLLPFMAAMLLLPVGACFDDPAVGKLTCQKNEGCPWGYACSSASRCCRSRNGTSCDVQDGAVADGAGAADVGAPRGQDAGSVATRDAGLRDDTASVGTGGDTTLGTGGDTMLGTGGARADGSAGAPGPDVNRDTPHDEGSDVPLLPDLGRGGVQGTGGRSGTGGIVTLGTGGRFGRGGAMGTGGQPGTGGIVIPGTGGKPGTGGTPGTGGVIGTGGSAVCGPPTVNLTGADAVANGPLITFNDNGGWCWYQDERAVVDANAGRLVVGSVAFGGSRNGDIEAVIYDLASGTKSGPKKLGNLNVDDHNAPAIVVRPDGGYVAMWAGHNQDCQSYYSVSDGTSWALQKTYDWSGQGCPWSQKITYANLWYLGTDLISFVRSVDTSPSYLISKDDGATWSYGGRLTSTPTVGYVAGYYKYWGNNTDRIDFVGTEAHPRDNDNNLYHGYVKDGKIYNSTGIVIDSTFADVSAQDITKFTRLFKTRDQVGGVAISHAWNSDLVRYADGTLGLIWTGRVASSSSTDPDLRLLYGRFDGASWKLTYLAKAGPKLYASEQDYTGLGALDPDDPTTIYISTPYNPSTDTMPTGAKREIWRGTTCDDGATFQWTPVTANSSNDNLRPIVPQWDAQHTALLWMRGEYRAAQDMTMAIVGTITGL